MWDDHSGTGGGRRYVGGRTGGTLCRHLSPRCYTLRSELQCPLYLLGLALDKEMMQVWVVPLAVKELMEESGKIFPLSPSKPPEPLPFSILCSSTSRFWHSCFLLGEGKDRIGPLGTSKLRYHCCLYDHFFLQNHCDICHCRLPLRRYLCSQMGLQTPALMNWFMTVLWNCHCRHIKGCQLWTTSSQTNYVLLLPSLTPINVVYSGIYPVRHRNCGCKHPHWLKECRRLLINGLGALF